MPARGLCFCLALIAICVSILLAQASLLVKCNVDGAVIYLDGQPIGFTDREGNFYRGDLNTGTHILRIEKDGYKGTERQIELGDLTETITLSLSRETSTQDSQNKAAPLEKYGSLLINSNVAGADVYVDNDLKGRTQVNGTALLEKIQSGYREVLIKKREFVDYRKTVSVAADLTLPLNVSLARKKEPEIARPILVGGLILVLSILVILLTFLIIRATGSVREGKAKFDRYVILGVIGRGGMAVIYKARDTSSGRIVALKIMDIGYLGDVDLVKKFVREGQVISDINRDYPHAPVVKVYRYGRENNRTSGRPFIAMELLQGRNLLELARSKKTYSVGFIIRVIEQIAEALQAAHAKGVYHRDVTPDNVILVKNDPVQPVIKLIDFGVARHEYTSAGTLDGSISGKPPYMSPEQCRGEKVDGRSDIYSLGINFYMLLTGQPPFVSRNPLEVMKDHERTPVPPIRVNIPASLVNIIFKMLEKDRSRRYQTIESFLFDLRTLAI
jgi:predicted Ser/Thr protein kinase